MTISKYTLLPIQNHTKMQLVKFFSLNVFICISFGVFPYVLNFKYILRDYNKLCKCIFPYVLEKLSILFFLQRLSS